MPLNDEIERLVARLESEQHPNASILDRLLCLEGEPVRSLSFNLSPI